MIEDNRKIYDDAFISVLSIEKTQLNDSLEYQSVDTWDSVAHMSLMAELEDAFDIELDMDDIVDFGTYLTGLETMRKYGVVI
jgi:acyl carrier protein